MRFAAFYLVEFYWLFFILLSDFEEFDLDSAINKLLSVVIHDIVFSDEHDFYFEELNPFHFS